MKGFRPERHKEMKHRLHTCLDCYHVQPIEFKDKYSKKLFKSTIETLLEVSFDDIMRSGKDLDLGKVGRFTFVKYKPLKRILNFNSKKGNKYLTHLNLHTSGFVFTSWWSIKYLSVKTNMNKWKCTLLRGNKGIKKKYHKFIISNDTSHITNKTH